MDTTDSAIKHVRIKPYNQQRGHVVQRLTLGQLGGRRFEAGNWYKLDAATAEFLSTVNQDGSQTDEPLDGMPRAFDVHEPKAAAKLANEELRKAAGIIPSTLMDAPDASSVHDAPTPSEGEDEDLAAEVAKERRAPRGKKAAAPATAR